MCSAHSSTSASHREPDHTQTSPTLPLGRMSCVHVLFAITLAVYVTQFTPHRWIPMRDTNTDKLFPDTHTYLYIHVLCPPLIFFAMVMYINIYNAHMHTYV